MKNIYQLALSYNKEAEDIIENEDHKMIDLEDSLLGSLKVSNSLKV